MSDHELRMKKRRWFHSGAMEDQASYLNAQIRHEGGAAVRELLELAAYCRNPVALLALGVEAPPLGDDLAQWVRGLARWGPRALAVGAVAAAHHAARDHAGECDHGILAIQATERWICEPTLANSKKALSEAASIEMNELSQAAQAQPWWEPSEAAARIAGAEASDLLEVEFGGSEPCNQAELLEDACERVLWAVEASARASDTSAVRKALETSLADWASAHIEETDPPPSEQGEP